ncbi:phosphate signaling complex protein PhoU [Haladaptatus sp. F3-133]|uniref:Phosphate-specific transport system accessory protein PhoU n=1 Tax=Halorutilus salinus TaxID=2487751 RepID=A0A9Q4C2Y2_9EURY|nr:phosphate signaling complex protein PhoU [Halorutilus salinus]MCX2817990.1 phosphate signaling complex protein PhoU [Halorutilus salinus]
MPRDDYRERLDTLRGEVVSTGETVVGRLRDALVALEDKDDELARRVVEGDDEVNERYLEIEQECVDLIALQQPVAGDLRFVVASFKIVTDLERVGDLAVNLSDRATEARRDRFAEVDVQEIGAFAASMVEDAVEAYENGDIEACRGVAESDDVLDTRCEGATRRVIRELADAAHEDADGSVSDAKNLLLTVRDLERVGDHGVNIAARTLYMVEHEDELLR